MYALIHSLLGDRKGGEIFTLFSLWHFLYIGLALLLIAAVLLLTVKRKQETKNKVATAFVNIAFGLYVADFFLMPFAYGEIDIEKLPFHICTAMCVMCFLSSHVGFLKPLKAHFALLGFISNLVYLIYPAGVMWHAVHPISYRVIQTLLFHAIMTVYGFLTIVYNREKLTFRRCPIDLLVLGGMTLWAFIGNKLYNGSAGTYSHFFNWFFVVEDPFGMIDKSISPYIMPFLNIVVFFAVELVIIGLLTLTRRSRKK